MMFILLGIVISLIVLFLYYSLIISSKCSKEEDEIYDRNKRSIREEENKKLQEKIIKNSDKSEDIEV